MLLSGPGCGRDILLSSSPSSGRVALIKAGLALASEPSLPIVLQRIVQLTDGRYRALGGHGPPVVASSAVGRTALPLKAGWSWCPDPAPHNLMDMKESNTSPSLILADRLLQARRLGEMVAGSSLPSFVCDPEGRLVSISPAAVEFFGLPSRLPAGRACWDVVRGCFEDGEPVCSKGCPILAALRAGLDVPVHRVNVRAGRAPSRRSVVHMHHLLLLDDEMQPGAVLHLVDEGSPRTQGKPVPGRFLG